MEWYEIYDDESGKTISFYASSVEQAIYQSEHIDYNQYHDGDRCSFAEKQIEEPTTFEKIIDNDRLWGTVLVLLSPAILAALFLAWTGTP